MKSKDKSRLLLEKETILARLQESVRIRWLFFRRPSTFVLLDQQFGAKAERFENADHLDSQVSWNRSERGE